VTDAGRGRTADGLACVSDDGEGMDEATREPVFEPFFTTRRVSGGTGLGLATSYGIVRQSGGAIQVENSPGLGSTFLVRLPVTEGPAGSG
jgi:two-component system, cell cycle sensor histidine kinase and response regulator CckA